ncbi:MAG: hypothetical protein MHMPM18_002851 [Marteilia pararefringens]
MDEFSSLYGKNSFQIIFLIVGMCQIPIAIAIRKIRNNSTAAKSLNLLATIILFLILRDRFSPLIFIFYVLVNYLALHAALLIPGEKKHLRTRAAMTILFSNLIVFCLGYVYSTGSILWINDSLNVYIMTFLIPRLTQVAFQQLTRDVTKVNHRRLTNLSDYVCYCLGYIGILTGPHLDVDNYLNIFYGMNEKESGNNDPAIGMKDKIRSFDFKHTIFHTKTLLACIIIYISANAMKNHETPIVKLLEGKLYALSFLSISSSILFVHALSYISFEILDYEKSLFLFPSESHANMMPNSLQSAYCKTSIRELFRMWNRSVVMWFDYTLRGNVPTKHLPKVVFITTILWHGPVYHYFATALYGYLLLQINKNHHKLLMRKRQLQWLNRRRNNKQYTVCSWILTIISISLCMKMMQRIDYRELNQIILYSPQNYIIYVTIFVQYILERILV